MSLKEAKKRTLWA